MTLRGIAHLWYPGPRLFSLRAVALGPHAYQNDRPARGGVSASLRRSRVVWLVRPRTHESYDTTRELNMKYSDMH